MKTSYPIAADLLADQFDQLCVSFFESHPCANPYYWKVALEFYHYMQNHPLNERYPYLDDLLRFEWLEIDVALMEDGPVPKLKEEGDLLVDHPSASFFGQD